MTGGNQIYFLDTEFQKEKCNEKGVSSDCLLLIKISCWQGRIDWVLKGRAEENKEVNIRKWVARIDCDTSGR